MSSDAIESAASEAQLADMYPGDQLEIACDMGAAVDYINTIAGDSFDATMDIHQPAFSAYLNRVLTMADNPPEEKTMTASEARVFISLKAVELIAAGADPDETERLVRALFAVLGAPKTGDPQ